MQDDLVLMDPNKESIFDFLKPFSPEDGSKGTFLALLIGGMEQAQALKAVKRKFRTISLWRRTDPDFYRIESRIQSAPAHLATEARVIRAGKMDLGLIEVTNHLVRRIIDGEHVPDGSWSFLSKMASMRIPLMLDEKGGGTDSWSKLSKILHPVMTQQEASFEQPNGTKVVLTEKRVDASQIGIDIIRNILSKDEDREE